MVESERKLDGVTARAEVDGRELVAHGVGLAAAGLGIADAELAIIVQSPALGLAIVEDRATMLQPERDKDRLAARAQIDGRELVTHLARIISSEFLVAQAQAATGVAAPA